jgi:hypothetical protein
MAESPVTIPGIDRSALDFLHFFWHHPRLLLLRGEDAGQEESNA